MEQLINKYDNIYFLHIHKTGGHYILNNIINPVRDIFKEQNKKILTGHLCWKPVKENTYVITSLRDPVKRTISHFEHIVKYDNDNNELISNSINSLMSWIDKNKQSIPNFQSKSLTFTNIVDEN
jgi:hypothetical protein